jgi:hypothetical protein
LNLDWKHSGLEKTLGIDTQDAWLQDMLLRSLMSTEYFCRTFLAETFYNKMTHQQKAALASVDDDTIPKLALCCYRSFGKSSFGESKAIQGVCFRKMPHAMFVGSNEGLATDSTENIKTELLTNPMIKEVFGKFKPSTRADMPFGFSKKAYFLVDPLTGESISFIHPKGAKQRVRGVRMKVAGRTYRPSFISIDDLEDDEEVMNSETRQKISRWFHNALLNCVDQQRPNSRTNRWTPDKSNPTWIPPWRVLYTDTLKHPDANIVHIMSDTEWVSHKYPQSEFRIDGEGKKQLFSLVPEIVSTSQVRASYEAAKKRIGGLTGYCQEFLCSPMSEEDACWQREMFHYYDEATVAGSNSMYGLNKDPNLDRFVIVDPARTNNMKSCPSGILFVAVDYKQGRVNFRKEINQRLSQDELLDTTFNTAFDMNTKVIAVEITGLGDAGKWMWINYAQMKGYNDFDFVWLEAKGLPKGDFGKGDDAAKRARASQILPLYQKHMIWHDVSLQGGSLEGQELSYPMSTQWDILDCAGYVPTMLDMSGRCFDAKATLHDPKAPVFEDRIDWDEMTKKIRSGAWRRV